MKNNEETGMLSKEKKTTGFLGSGGLGWQGNRLQRSEWTSSLSDSVMGWTVSPKNLYIEVQPQDLRVWPSGESIFKKWLN